MDGLLRVMQVVAKDFTPCEQALLPVYNTITKAMDDFKSGVSGRMYHWLLGRIIKGEV